MSLRLRRGSFRKSFPPQTQDVEGEQDRLGSRRTASLSPTWGFRVAPADSPGRTRPCWTVQHDKLAVEDDVGQKQRSHGIGPQRKDPAGDPVPTIPRPLVAERVRMYLLVPAPRASCTVGSTHRCQGRKSRPASEASAGCRTLH